MRARNLVLMTCSWRLLLRPPGRLNGDVVLSLAVPGSNWSSLLCLRLHGWSGLHSSSISWSEAGPALAVSPPRAKRRIHRVQNIPKMVAKSPKISTKSTNWSSSHQLGLQNDAKLALLPRFHQVPIESPL
ncbi:hypothetical protein TNCV_2424581 [Trichonephila clavipes]|nr:hypothetical protein TNCV_2424581 [Trichonephila clavipes]